jgi:ADP-glucose pyrophosphorylase
MHMAGQRGVVDQDAVVADDAVMADVGIGHDQVVIAQVVSERSCTVPR